MNSHSTGPWTDEGFESIAAERGHFYGGMIIAADGETIVAQCVMPHNMPVLKAAPELLKSAEKVLAWWASYLDTLPFEKRVEDAEWSEFNDLRKAVKKASSQS